MTDFYVKSGGAFNYANRPWTLGETMVPVPTDASANVAQGRKAVWEVTTAATSTATPTWPASAPTYDSTTITQNGVVWTARKPGYSSGATANWAFATSYWLYAFNAASPGDRIFISNNHAESVSGVTWTFNVGTDVANQVQSLCVDDSATPPTTLATGATVTNTTTGTMVFLSPMYVYGLTISNGSGGTGGSITFNNASNNLQMTFEQCKFRFASSASNIFQFGTSTGGIEVRLINTTFRFGASNQRISLQRGTMEWIGGGIESGGTAPAALINASLSAGSQARLVAYGLDLTALGNNDLLQSQPLGSTSWTFVNCQMPSSWTGNLWSSTPTFQGAVAEMINCGNASSELPQRLLWNSYGAVRANTAAAIVGGSTDGATGYTWKMDSSANPVFPNRALQSPMAEVYNSSTGSALTATVEFAANTTAMPTDQELTLELHYLATALSPLTALIEDVGASSLATPASQSSTSTDWTAGAAARSNGAAVTTASSPFKVASNPGRLFAVTGAGTLSGSEPGAYTTAIDGDSFADGTATIRALWRGKLSVSITPRVAGTLRWTANLFKASSQVFVDPSVTLT